MEQKEKHHSIASVLGDISLTVFAVGIVGITFMGVSGLTPKNSQRVADTSSTVLGVSTKYKMLSFFPENVANVPFVTKSTLSGNTTLDGQVKITLTFTPLQASTYELPLLTIKNASQEYKKVSMSPEFSLDNSFTSISLTFAGQTTEIISVLGVVTPLDLVVPPNSSSPLSLTIQPRVQLATPVTLSLDFTELP